MPEEIRVERAEKGAMEVRRRKDRKLRNCMFEMVKGRERMRMCLQGVSVLVAVDQDP